MSTASGPALSPAPALKAWFEGDGKGVRVRIPVVVVPDPLGLSSGFVGAVAGPAPADALHLKLDDTAMSVSLADRIAKDCPYDQPCAIWVEGIWGATLPGLDLGGLGGPGLGGFDSGPTKHPFSVRDYAGKVDGDASHVLVVTAG